MEKVWFTRSKQRVFINNKWWVGKTTLSYNVGKYFANSWYKTVLIDLDPQCNLSLQALGDNLVNKWLFEHNNIYDVLKPVIDVTGDLRIIFKELSNWKYEIVELYNVWTHSQLYK